jgi:hypothetical protein
VASEAAFDLNFEQERTERGPTRGPVFGDFVHAASGRRLLVMVEPVAMTSRARDNVAMILEDAGSRFRAQPLMALRDIVVDCCDHAIHAVDRPTGPTLRTAGVTAAIIDGNRVVIARTSPGAVLLVQDGKLVADPILHESVRPPAEGDDRSLLNVDFQPDDVLVLCSSAFHASFKRAGEANPGNLSALAAALAGDVNDLMVELEELAKDDDLDASAGLLLFEQSFDRAVIWQPMGEVSTAAESATVTEETESKLTPAPPAKIVSIYAERQLRMWPNWQGARIGRPDNAPRSTLHVESRYERFHTYLLHAFESHVPKHGPSAIVFGGGSAKAIVPGASTVQLFRGTYGCEAMTGLRTRLPRGPRVHIPTKLISMVLAILVLLASVAYLYDRREGRAEVAREAITAADVQLASAANETNPVTLAAELSLAEKALATAEANGASDKQLEPRRQALANVKDRIANIVRLTDITRVGMVPPDVAVLNPKLIQHGDNVYLVAGGLYQLDPATKSLNLILKQDKKIAGGRVGTLIGGTVDRHGITLTDGTAIFRQGTTGKWKRMEIFTIGDEPWYEAAICGTFEGSFYILNNSSGQILKFEAEELDSVQEPWTTQAVTEDLEHAVDMVVLDKIYVLLDDGSLMSFFQGEPDATFSITANPGITSPTVLFGGQVVNFLYIADKGNGTGRISRVTTSGDLSKQYLLPEKGQEGYVGGAEHAFANIGDLVVNEANGQIVILSGDQIWAATIPSAEALAG